MFGALLFETLAVLTIFVFRWRFPDVERPYRCLGYPVVPALFGLLSAFILYYKFVGNPKEALIGLGFIAVGMGVFRAARLDRPPAT
jgi:hypothetical protein